MHDDLEGLFWLPQHTPLTLTPQTPHQSRPLI